jgi:osmotically-inducible protein OsmY
MKTDFELKKDVLAELSWDPLVPESKIGVAVSDSVVTLSGHLNTYVEKVAAKRATQRVAGIKAIAVELDVIPIGDHQRSDTEIAMLIEQSLSWNATLPQKRVKVVVENGWVTLEGELDWNFQRNIVEELIRPLKGVVGITNNIRLKSLVVPENLAEQIQEAFARQALREAKRIQIEVDGNVVTLKGHVHSWAERTAAEGVTWAAQGVSRVNNKLTVDA